ncbi:MAG: hypothetical protein IJL31_04795 [Oscillospiraceae bacterium]|nr:hypothetical protein [Oscillospiraceae bacterium]
MNESQARERTPGKSGALRTVKAVVIVTVVLAVVILAAALLFPKLFNTDSFVRFFRYMGLKDRKNYGEISFDAGSANGYAAFGGGILVSGEGGLILYDLEGDQKAFVQAHFPSPVLAAGETVSFCFSPGSSYVSAVDESGKICLDEALTGEVLDADVSNDGYTAYILTETGYKSVATVRNRDMNPTFRFSSRTRYLNACAVSEGGDYLALATLGEENSVYRSSVRILRTDETLNDLDEDGSSAIQVDLGNQIIFDLDFLDRTHLCAIGQDNVTFFDVEGNITTRVALSGQTVLDYEFSADGFMALALEQNVAGSGKRIQILDRTGELLGETTPEGALHDVSVKDEYVAVLTDRDLQICNRRLKLFYRTEELHDATGVLVRDDGTALLLSNSSAHLYIP